MEGLLVLFGLVAVAWILATPILLILHVRLGGRVAELAQQIKRLEAREPSETTPDLPAQPKASEPVEPPPISVPEDAQPSATTPEEIPPPVSARVPRFDAVDTLNIPDTAEQEAPPKAYVFRKDKIDGLSLWLKENWVLAAGAASLSLAGIFLVQYGAERGLLTPFWRVMAALVFGVVLMVGGEFMRRRFGDDTQADTQFLPSALSGAGLVTLFAAVLSAYALYDLIGPGMSFAGLAVVSAIGVVFGWFYGPVLTAVGILGATLAPYLTGEDSDAAWLLHYYFALIALAALAIDAFKRWAWVSVLALLASAASIWLTYLGTDASLHFIAATLIVAAGAVAIPQRQLVPRHEGAPVIGLLWRQLPEFPTRLSFGATLNAGAAALAVSLMGTNLADAYLGLVAMVILMIATTLWMRYAPALVDHAVIPSLSFLGLIATQALLVGPLYGSFKIASSRPPETSPPSTIWLLLAVAAVGSVLMYWRIPRAPMPLIWALAASSLAPISVFLLEFLWVPGWVHGDYPWALAVMAIAALMTVLAERSSRFDVGDRALITALLAVAALSLIGLALFLVLTKTALTLALAAMILLVAVLDRRFDLPLLAVYAMIGAAVITYRLVIDPGVAWALDHPPLFQVILSYGGTMAILAAAWSVVRGPRPRLAVILESTIWVLAAMFILVQFERLLPGRGLETHWGLGLLAAVWATTALAQVHRLQGGPKFERIIRWCLTGVFAMITVAILALRFALFNPLDGELVLGAPFFSTLAIAYLPMAIVLGLGAWKLSGLGRLPRVGLAVVSSAYVVLYIGLSIRHFWRGADLSVRGFTDPELYSYTIAMLLASAGLLVIAFWTRSDWLRKLAMAGIGLTIAKVFLVDTAGLAGLLRVVSFMGLGLALLALTWLNRVMSAQWEKADAKE